MPRLASALAAALAAAACAPLASAARQPAVDSDEPLLPDNHLVEALAPKFALDSLLNRTGPPDADIKTNGLVDGLLDTICAISTVTAAIDAKAAIEFKLQKPSDLLTNTHMEDVRKEFEAWASGGSNSAADFRNHDPYVQMKAIIAVLDNMEKQCVPEEGFLEALTRWPGYLIDVFSSAVNDTHKEKQQKLVKAQQDIKDLVTKVREAYKEIVTAHCKDFEENALNRMVNAMALMRKWEDLTKHSWFAMDREVNWMSGARMPKFVDSAMPGLAEQCRPSWYGTESPGEVAESPTVKLGQAFNERQMFNKIASELGQAGVFLDTLHEECSWHFTEDHRARLPEVARLMDCDGELNIKLLSTSIRSGVGSVFSAINSVLIHPALGLEGEVENLYTIAVELGSQSALPLVSLITWAVLKTAQTADPFDVCLRAADAISRRPISQEEMQAVSVAAS